MQKKSRIPPFPMWRWRLGLWRMGRVCGRRWQLRRIKVLREQGWLGRRVVGYVLTKLTWPITRLLERDLIRREEIMKVREAIWINERWIGLCMEKWWWELWSRGVVGWRGEGGYTHGLGRHILLLDLLRSRIRALIYLGLVANVWDSSNSNDKKLSKYYVSYS